MTNIQKWINALRNPIEEQAYGRMMNDHGLDVLGVACMLYWKETSKGYWDKYAFYDGEGGAGTHAMPEGVVNWLGLNERDPIINGKRLSELNSDFNFNELADLIEKNLLPNTKGI